MTTKAAKEAALAVTLTLCTAALTFLMFSGLVWLAVTWSTLIK
jgi:hypothetical protein